MVKGTTGTITGNSGDYEIHIPKYLHEETFKQDYKIELEKQCDETGGRPWKEVPLKFWSSLIFLSLMGRI